MADILDIETALANLCGATIYPLGTGQPSAAGIDCKIYPGWPSSAELAVSLAAGQAEISIYSGQNLERDTTRYRREWLDLTLGVATLAAVVSNSTITLSGMITANNYVTLIIDGAAWSYLVLGTDTLTTIAAALVAQMPAGYGASSVAGVITVAAKYNGLIVARVAAPGTVSREVGRQQRGMMVSIWAPSPQARSAIASLLMSTIRGTDFISFADGTIGWVTYRQSNESDGAENAMAYRRDINIWVEYQTIQTATGYPITSVGITQVGANAVGDLGPSKIFNA